MVASLGVLLEARDNLLLYGVVGSLAGTGRADPARRARNMLALKKCIVSVQLIDLVLFLKKKKKKKGNNRP